MLHRVYEPLSKIKHLIFYVILLIISKYILLAKHYWIYYIILILLTRCKYNGIVHWKRVCFYRCVEEWISEFFALSYLCRVGFESHLSAIWLSDSKIGQSERNNSLHRVKLIFFNRCNGCVWWPLCKFNKKGKPSNARRTLLKRLVWRHTSLC